MPQLASDFQTDQIIRRSRRRPHKGTGTRREDRAGYFASGSRPIRLNHHSSLGQELGGLLQQSRHARSGSGALKRSDALRRNSHRQSDRTRPQ